VVYIRRVRLIFFGSGEIPKHGVGLMLWALHTVETRCGDISLSVNFEETELIFRRRRKVPGLFEPLFFGVTFALFHVGQLSRDSPGFSADLEGACGCQGKEGSQSAAGGPMVRHWA
jgi:hypothetical protein